MTSNLHVQDRKLSVASAAIVLVLLVQSAVHAQSANARPAAQAAQSAVHNQNLGECTPNSLSLDLVAAQTCYKQDDILTVEVNMSCLPQVTDGFQAFLAFDPAVLQYQGANSTYTTSPFFLHIQNIATAEVSPGQINLDGSINFTSNGTTQDALLATLVFTVLPGNDGLVTSIGFRSAMPFFSEFSAAGNPIATTLVHGEPFAIDQTAPMLVCSADATIECDASTDPSNTGTSTATDDCDEAPLVIFADVNTSGLCANEMMITRTWTATDSAGHVSTCDQLITVEDSTAPDITCPADTTVECNESTDPSNTGTATATDNCDGAPMVTFSDVSTTGLCADDEIITRTWTATDACGNVATCDQIITVADSTEPVITCPSDTTIECDESTDPTNTGTASATDNCDGAPVVTFSDVSTTGLCADDEIITRTWTATDACGNVSTCGQIITVQDTIVPVITCPLDTIIECDESSDPSNTGVATATDNCDGAPVVTFNDVTTNGLCADEEIITRTWTATDACGNSSDCDQIITVADETAPTFQSVPSDIVVNADAGGCTATLTSAGIGTPVADDNCDAEVDISFARSDGAPNIDDPFDAVDSPIAITWTATDNCGNFAQHIQTVTVNGVQDMTLTVVLAGVDAGASLTRCITFVPKDGNSCADAEDMLVEFTGNPATGVAVFSVSCGNWTHVCAKDEQHTKWDTQGLIAAGGEFETEAPLVLEGGDTDNDSDVDINDVTLLLAQYGTLAQPGGCPWDGTRDADFSNNGSVGVEDYTFLTTYWLTASSCECSTPPLMGPGDTDEVALTPLQTRRELDAEAPTYLRQADLNDDGVIDYLDVRIFEVNNGLPSTLSEKLRRTGELQAAPVGAAASTGL